MSFFSRVFRRSTAKVEQGEKKVEQADKMAEDIQEWDTAKLELAGLGDVKAEEDIQEWDNKKVTILLCVLLKFFLLTNCVMWCW